MPKQPLKTPVGTRRRTSKLAAQIVDRAHRKLYVLDTNVLMHDPKCLYRFEEHDIFIPMVTLEELDHNKKGPSENARNAREASRTLYDIVSSCENDIKVGIELAICSQGQATGRLFFQTEALDDTDLPVKLSFSVKDNQILAVVAALHKKEEQQDNPRKVVLVTKDINMQIKACALGLMVQDYRNDQVLEDTDLLYTGILDLPKNFWHTHGKDLKSWIEGERSFFEVSGKLCPDFLINQMVALDLDDSKKSLQAIVTKREGGRATLQTLINYTNQKNAVWGIMARNREQNFALNLLMDPEIDFVTLLGQAGTGKTLLTLAAALVQTFEGEKRYSDIIITRVTVPVGDDIGFLPGTEEEKMTPWMGAFEDNLDVLNRPPVSSHKDDAQHGQHDSGNDWGRAVTMDLIRSRIKFKSINFMRGRTFINKFVIIDEAQNLTPKQMKTLITRAGPGTKLVCLGNIAQIDTPYLTEGSSGLTYVVDRFKGFTHGGHVTLRKGERSRLADYAAEVL